MDAPVSPGRRAPARREGNGNSSSRSLRRPIWAAKHTVRGPVSDAGSRLNWEDARLQGGATAGPRRVGAAEECLADASVPAVVDIVPGCQASDLELPSRPTYWSLAGLRRRVRLVDAAAAYAGTARARTPRRRGETSPRTNWNAGYTRAARDAELRRQPDSGEARRAHSERSTSPVSPGARRRRRDRRCPAVLALAPDPSD